MKYKNHYIYEKVPSEIPEWKELFDKEYEKQTSPLEVSDVFTPHNFAKLHNWVSEIKFNLLTPEAKDVPEFIKEYIYEDPTLENLKKELLEKAVKYDGFDKPIIALDLETTGLSTKGKLIKGKFVPDTKIVSVPIAVSPYEGYVIPVMHTETDGIKNYDWSIVRDFIQWLVDNFHLIVHNAQFDLSHLSNWGVLIKNVSFTDTMLVSKLMNNQEFMPMSVGHGLKNLSEYVLNRKMLEINEILNLKTKTHIQFDRLPVTNALTYAVSDAVNTYALFKAFVIDDIYGRNPYKEQPLTTKIVHTALYPVISSLRYGLLVDKERVINSIKTINVRSIILEEKFHTILKKYGYTEELSLLSPMVSVIIVNYILKPNWDQDESQFYSYIKEYFGLEVKRNKLKNGTEKEQINMDDSILKKFKTGIKNSIFSDTIKEDVSTILEIISLYRSLSKDLASYYGLLYNLFIDDRNHFLVNINLKYLSTDTFRFANEKGSGHSEYATYKKLKTKNNVKLKKGNGLAHAINTQGMPSDPPKLVKLKKVKTKLSKMQDLEREAERRMVEVLVSWEYDKKG